MARAFLGLLRDSQCKATPATFFTPRRQLPPRGLLAYSLQIDQVIERGKALDVPQGRAARGLSIYQSAWAWFGHGAHSAKRQLGAVDQYQVGGGMGLQPYIFFVGKSRKGYFFRRMSLAQFGRARHELDRLGAEVDAVLLGSLL